MHQTNHNNKNKKDKIYKKWMNKNKILKNNKQIKEKWLMKGNKRLINLNLNNLKI
jgi:hypothetical protein